MMRHYLLLIPVIILLLASCANRAMGPQGGPKDITPPRLIKSMPENKQLNVATKEIELEFSEFVSLEKPGQNIIISPPQVLPPTIRTASKKILVTLEDSLQENTTYSIDFTNAIVDITEKNPLSGFTYSFSTGDKVDTLEIAGMVIDAENLNPIPGIMVGIYDDLNDTAFVTNKPLRISRTNEEGLFSIKSVKEGQYHIFALKDLNRDYIYNDPNEQLAFSDSIIIPSVKSVIIKDTTSIIPDSTSSDSIKKERTKTVFLPDNLVLLAFKEKVAKQYFLKGERKDPYKISFYFNAPNKKRPIITPLNFEKNELDLIQTSIQVDSIYYWVTDSVSYKQDTLKLSISYEKADSTGYILMQTDTVALAYKKSKVAKGRNAKSAPKNLLPLSTNITRSIEIYDQAEFSFNLPILRVDSTKVHLYYKKDTLWKELPIHLKKADELGFKYGFPFKWDTELSYKIEVDSAAFFSIYNTHTMARSLPFTVKALDQYALLIVSLTNNPRNSIVQLLNKKDLLIKSAQVEDNEVVFEHLKPGDYYLRLFVDNNKNGIWDPGKDSDKLQAEKVFYFNAPLNLRANWDVEQEWDIKTTTLTMQKPKELIPKIKR
jgi:hypothetical protein